jgi:hypothetical protein
MKKIISFSLFGSNPIYLKGLDRNIELSRIHYPNWKIRVYADTENYSKINKYRHDEKIEIVEFRSEFSNQGLFERFKPLFDKDVDIWVSRDLDSSITSREVAAVNEWLESGRDLHVMRDSHNHSYPIMAGMFGMRKINAFSRLRIESLMEKYFSSDMTSDQRFLAQVIWKKFKPNTLIHDHWKKTAVTVLPKDVSPSEGTSVKEAYGVGIYDYITYIRELRHPEIFPKNALIKNFPRDSKPYEPLYVGQVVLPNNTPAYSQDMRWEYELRGRSIPKEFRII